MENLIAALVLGAYIIMICVLVFYVLKYAMPKKQTTDKPDDDARIFGFRYSTKEDIDKRLKEISKYKF